MVPLILHHKDTEFTLSVPAWFITEYMPKANGDFVKVYLFLLLTATRSDANLSIATLADRLFCTESDVIRALKYWDQQGLLSLKMDEKDVPQEVSFVSHAKKQQKEALPEHSEKAEPAQQDHTHDPEEGARTAPPKPAMLVYPPDPEFQTLVRISEQYMSRPLTPTEVEMFAGWYQTTDKNFDLIDYLVQYCVEKGKTKLSYMNQVLSNWQNEGITTVKEAKESNRVQAEDGRRFLRCFGIVDRVLSTEESRKLDYWKKNLGFSMELILEAARQTMRLKGGLKLDYLDSILQSWNEKNIRTMEDVLKAEQEHKAARTAAQTGSSHPKPDAAKTRRSSGAPNRFHNFDQRTYDYQEWEQELLEPYQSSSAPAISDEDWEKMLAPYRSGKA